MIPITTYDIHLSIDRDGMPLLKADITVSGKDGQQLGHTIVTDLLFTLETDDD